MFEKAPFFSDGQGKLTPRSKGQDKIPKKFPHRPEFMIWMFETPSKRRLLWMIANYPYIFNTFFLSDINRNFNKQGVVGTNTPLAKALLVCHSLKMDGYVYQSKDFQKYHLTLTGRLYRITSYPGFPLITTLTAITLIILGVLNYTKKTTVIERIIEKQVPIQDTNQQKTDDFGNSSNLQNLDGIVGDTSLDSVNKTKTLVK